MTLDDLNKEDACKHLLEAPAPIVVGRLTSELRKYISLVEELKMLKRHRYIDEDKIDDLLTKYLPYEI